MMDHEAYNAAKALQDSAAAKAIGMLTALIEGSLPVHHHQQAREIIAQWDYSSTAIMAAICAPDPLTIHVIKDDERKQSQLESWLISPAREAHNTGATEHGEQDSNASVLPQAQDERRGTTG